VSSTVRKPSITKARWAPVSSLWLERVRLYHTYLVLGRQQSRRAIVPPSGNTSQIENVSQSVYNSVVAVSSPTSSSFEISVTRPGTSPTTNDLQGYYGIATDVVSTCNRQTYFNSQRASAFVAYLGSFAGQFMALAWVYVAEGATWGLLLGDL
jgi:hypothetical protein